MKKYFFFFLFACSVTAHFAVAQVNVRDSLIAITLVTVTGSYQVPGGDMADRFSNNFTVGANVQRKTKANWLWGAEINFIFGGEVKENNILSDISTSQGYIIAGNGTYADVFLYERGYSVFLKAGKIFPVLGPNKNSGLTATFGVGFLQHKIRIEDKGNLVAALSTEYKKGYDRLTNGLCLNQFVGYSNFSNNKRINFYAGIEATEGFTQNRRSFNFDTASKEDAARMDFFLGIKVGWIIPIYKKVPKDFYYN